MVWLVEGEKQKQLKCKFEGKTGHHDSVRSVDCFETFDDDTVVVSGGDCTVRLWSGMLYVTT